MPGPQYLTVDTLKGYTPIPSDDIDALNQQEPGYIDAQLRVWTSQINSRLGKRYKRPIPDPVPEIVLGWLGTFVTIEIYLKRGVNPQDPALTLIQKKTDFADAQMKEAADAKDGLFDIPIDDSADASAISKGTPLASSNADPYEWQDQQAEAVRGGC